MHYLWNLFLAGAFVMQQSMAVPTMLLNPQNAFSPSSLTQPQVTQMNLSPNSMGISNGQPFNLARPPVMQSLPNTMNAQPIMPPNAMFKQSSNNAMLQVNSGQNGFMLSSQGTPNPSPMTTCRYQIKFTLKPGTNALLNEFNVQSELKRILNLASLDSLNYQNWKLQQDGIIMDAPKDGITRLPQFNGKFNLATFNGIRLDDLSPFEATVANEVCVTIFP
jgi:hypothetical protein